MILITTSRKPHMKTRQFARTLANLLPNAKYVTRGKKDVNSLAEYAQQSGLGRIGIVGESHGNLGVIEFITVDAGGWEWAPREMRIASAEFGKLRKRFDEIVVDGPQKDDMTELFGIEELEGADLVVAAGDEITFADKGAVLLRMHAKIIERKS